ncbi:MAG TPA: carboxymuconolactone decarboxylase family protein [Thermotogota bacterium]|nr:carboxymuconolactone decarboxylase family protein [Thermotogota bacterium]HPJ89863.1 carboxymuconolactone decarboxylase family protein [Thermotogota bacterium]
MKTSRQKMFSVAEFYQVMDKAFSTMKAVRNAREKGLMDDKLQTKIMLTVTDVNDCPLCRTFHTKNAEKIGIDEDKINLLNNGFVLEVDENTQAYIFAKRYAERDGEYSDEDWFDLVQKYGEEKARGILGIVRIVMMGNALGIACNNFGKRMTFRPVKGSSFYKELSIILTLIPFMLFILIKNLFVGN